MFLLIHWAFHTVFDHIHISFPNSSQIHSLHSHVLTYPNLSVLLLFLNTLNIMCVVQLLLAMGYGVSTRVHIIKENWLFLSPNSCWIPIALQLVVEFSAISLYNLHARILFDLSFHRPWVYCLNCCAFLRATPCCIWKTLFPLTYFWLLRSNILYIIHAIFCPLFNHDTVAGIKNLFKLTVHSTD